MPVYSLPYSQWKDLKFPTNVSNTYHLAYYLVWIMLPLVAIFHTKHEQYGCSACSWLSLFYSSFHRPCCKRTGNFLSWKSLIFSINLKVFWVLLNKSAWRCCCAQSILCLKSSTFSVPYIVSVQLVLISHSQWDCPPKHRNNKLMPNIMHAIGLGFFTLRLWLSSIWNPFTWKKVYIHFTMEYMKFWGLMDVLQPTHKKNHNGNDG